ncbi:MAG TPA: PPOX class F420-dependent oxidoreductase [Pilimelia sp.]|nr:PPOX class F420-dependent oxidoreductase [Pilimelia sp.]
MATSLPELAQRLIDAPTFPTIATVNADASPQASVIWVKRDGTDILFSTVRGRRKTRNMEREPRVSLVVVNPDNPYNYVEIRGTVTLDDAGGKELIDELSVKYTGQPYTEDGPDVVRVVCRLTPEHVTGM